MLDFTALWGQVHVFPPRAASLCAALVVAAGALGLPAPGAALELFGMNFFGGKGKGTAEPEVFEPQPYEINFQVVGADEELADRIRAASNLYTQRERPASGTSGLLGRARGDYGRILAALYRNARYGGSIQILIAGQPPEAMEPDADLPNPVSVTVRVETGPLYRFGNVASENRPPFAMEEIERLESARELGLAAGEPARSTAILATEASLIEAWRQLGHPMAEIAARDIVADHRTRTVDVMLRAEPGPPALFNGVMVTGAERMDPSFVAYLTGIASGEEYDPDAIEAATERLRNLQVFRSVIIEEAEALTPAGLLPLTVRVAERPLRVFGVGAAYSTIDGASIEGHWTHRNLFGHAERLRIEARIQGIDSTEVEEFEYFAGAHFTRPGVLTPDTDFVAQAEAERENLEAFERTAVSVRAGFAHRFSPDLTGDIALAAERSQIEDAFGERNFLLASVPGELTYDNRDSLLNPTEGVRATLFAEPFYELERGDGAALSKGQVASYLAFDEEDRFVLAGRLAGGIVAGASLADIPSDRLFLAGGGGSIRGYEFQSIGVTLPGGELVGGRSLVEASLEFRARVTERIGIVPFVDLGSVDEDVIPDFSEEIKVGVGVGLRYHTALGPIRVDAAVPLDPGPEGADFALYLGIGQAF